MAFPIPNFVIDKIYSHNNITTYPRPDMLINSYVWALGNDFGNVIEREEMKKKIYLQFPIKAISKDNEKIRNRQGFVFTSSKYKTFEEQVKFYAIAQYKGEPLEGDIEVDLVFGFTNKNHCDLFNLPKSVCDALQGICYKNDRQIKKGSVKIFYSNAYLFSITISQLQGGEV